MQFWIFTFKWFSKFYSKKGELREIIRADYYLIIITHNDREYCNWPSKILKLKSFIHHAINSARFCWYNYLFKYHWIVARNLASSVADLAMIQDSKLWWFQDWLGGEWIGSRRKVGERFQSPDTSPPDFFRVDCNFIDV